MASTADIVAARRARLRAWIDERHAGVQQGFIAATGINQGELSALLGSKSFGEKKARALELAAKMPDGYLVAPLVAMYDLGKRSGGMNRLARDPPVVAPDDLARALLAKATPRSHRALTAIIEAAQRGKLTDGDIELLGAIAKRFQQ